MPKHTATKVRKMTNVPLTEGIILAILSAVVGFFAAWLPYKRDRAKDRLAVDTAVDERVEAMYEKLCAAQQNRINQIQEHYRQAEVLADARYAAILARYDALAEKYDSLKQRYDAMVANYETQLQSLRERVFELENDKRGG